MQSFPKSCIKLYQSASPCVRTQPVQTDCNPSPALTSVKIGGGEKGSSTFAELLWIILLLQQARYDSQQMTKSTKPPDLYFTFASTLYSSSQKSFLGECQSSSLTYITIYSPFLLQYPKWNRHAITKPAHVILYSLQFPTSHLKNKYFTVI